MSGASTGGFPGLAGPGASPDSGGGASGDGAGSGAGWALAPVPTARAPTAASAENHRCMALRIAPQYSESTRVLGAWGSVDPGLATVLIEPRFSALVKENWKATGGHGTVGLELVFSVLFGFFGGRALDNWLGTAPWLAVVGLGFGIATAIRFLYRALQRANKEAEKLEQEEKAARERYHDDDRENPD